MKNRYYNYFCIMTNAICNFFNKINKNNGGIPLSLTVEILLWLSCRTAELKAH